MEKHNPFVWQQRKFLALSIAAGSFAVGLILFLNRTAIQEIFQPASQQTQQKESSEASSEKAGMVLSNGGFGKTIAPLEQEAKAQLFNFPIPTRFEGKVLEEVKLSGKEKAIALTFDDGPEPPYTQQVLEILKKNNIKATFFVIGQNLKAYPQLGQKIVADGHALANHTWSHTYRHFSPSGAANEIEKTTALIYKTTGVKTSIFRPPGGYLNNGPAGYAKQHKYFIAMWSADSSDWKRPSVATLVNNVVRQAQPGGMALMHDGGGYRSHTVQALPKIIAQLKKRGYKFVTVPELLEMADKELKLKEAAKSSSSAGVNHQTPSKPPKKK
ncbi:MAG: polysaccharide deacetylase family protein [Aphanothece sp. CMT-3BRIN-NPC111]|nr:polysaccharide deacetylase family protein [Aphanothece sp. CMT-3BRIN-NPC111]